MDAEGRFHSAIAALTCSIMFSLITLSQQWLKYVIVDYTVGTFVVGGVSTLLAGAVIYKMLATLLLVLCRHWRWVKKLILGAAYLEGTWIGEVTGKGGDIRIVVEYFEQNLFSLVVRGKSFTTAWGEHAYWYTNAAKIDVVSGMLFCNYQTKILYRDTPVDGIGVFHFFREKPSSAPTTMTGYLIDTDNGKAMPIKYLIKVDDILDEKVAIDEYQRLKSGG